MVEYDYTNLRRNLETKVLDLAHNGIIAIDKYGDIKVFNSTSRRVTGISFQEANDPSIIEIVPGMSQLYEILKEGKIHIGKRLIINNTSIIANINPIRQGQEYLGAVAVFQDISEINEIEKSISLLKTLDTILENSYEGIVVIDKNGVVTTINSFFARFLGTKPGAVVGRHITEISPDTKLISTLETGRIDIGEIHHLGKNNIIVMRIPIFEGDKIVGAIGKMLFRDVKELRSLIQKIDNMEKELKYYKSELKKMHGAKYDFDNIVAESKKRKKIIELSKRAAMTDSTILIYGETGTGKELLAHAIHNNSLRRYGSFVRINCAAIPEELLESELFGYEKGAFTGARSEGKIGKFELANGGTIFLDEIGDMPLYMQSKLLRVLQEREVEKIGGNYAMGIDIRIIAATNRNLEKLVYEGKFRQDLYYRINVLQITIPPLRETKKDIKPMIKKITGELKEQLGINVKGITDEALELLKSYNWPGNIRELRNVIERAINMCDSENIELEDLPSSLRKTFNIDKKDICPEENTDDGLTLKSTVAQAEVRVIKRALKYTNGNKKEAAKLLGIHRSGLYQKLKEYKID